MNTQLIDLLTSYKCESPVITNIKSKLPSIIVPDIHARWKFVVDVFAKYSPNKYNIIFTGDIIHSEGPENKWRQIEQYIIRNCGGHFNNVSEAMQEEIDNSCKALELILSFQKQFPDSVFLLRGNHDDISCKIQGDYGKYARVCMESALFREALKVVDKNLLHAYYQFEKKMPYLYVGHDFLASHTIPDEKWTLKDIKFNDKRTHWSFSWADNTNYSSSCLMHFEGNLGRLGSNARYWFCGHRPVEKDQLVRTQCGGKLVQNNHPDCQVIIDKPYEGDYIASLL